jgi:hypothetical protein
MPKSPNPSGICQCGCGKPTNRAVATDLSKNRVKGEFQCFRVGHRTRRDTLEERFWSKVRKGPRCWEWLATIDAGGYGRIAGRDGRKLEGAHRVSYELNVGPIPDGMEVCHTCDKPDCTRPDHLWLGTHGDNMHDMWRKERNPIIRLTRGHELEVKELVSEGWGKQWIADAYGVSLSTVNYLKKRIFPGRKN